MFRRIDLDNPDAPALDLNACASEVIRWVRGPDAEGKTRADLADLLEAEHVELRREGLLRMPVEGVEARHPNSVPPGAPGRQPGRIAAPRPGRSS